MNSYKNQFSKTILEKADKFKGEITDIKHTTSTIRATIKTNKEFNVKFIIEEGIMFDSNCSCSSKTHCVHEAVFIKFLEEYPEILEDHKEYYKKSESVLNVNTDYILKYVSSTKLNSFMKKEFKKNLRLKYDFIKYFQDKSLIDKKIYEKKLNTLFIQSKGEGFSYDGYYDLRKLANPLKRYMREEIKELIEMEECQFASELLNTIMDRLHDEIYFVDRTIDYIVYYFQDYADILIYEDISKETKDKLESHLFFVASFGY